MSREMKIAISAVGVMALCILLGFLFGSFSSSMAVVPAVVVGAAVGLLLDVFLGSVAFAVIVVSRLLEGDKTPLTGGE